MNPIFHIGLSKTGTTLLQENYFSKLPEIEFLGKAKAVSIEKLIQEQAKPILVSHEHLLACPWDHHETSWLDTFKKNLRQLHAWFPDARIMLSLRSHFPLIKSFYKEMVSKPGRAAYPNFDEFFSLDTQKTTWLKPEEFIFESLIKECETVFESPPFVFFFEEILKTPDELDQGIRAFLGIGSTETSLQDCLGKVVNQGTRMKQTEWLRKLNRLNLSLEQKTKLLSLYGPLFRKLRITPELICRRHMANWPKEKFDLAPDLKKSIESFYRLDLDSCKKYIRATRKQQLQSSKK